MINRFHPRLINAKSKIDNIVCLLIALERCGASLDETVLEGAICGVRKLAADAYYDMDVAEKSVNPSELKDQLK